MKRQLAMIQSAGPHQKWLDFALISFHGEKQTSVVINHLVYGVVHKMHVTLCLCLPYTLILEMLYAGKATCISRTDWIL